MTDNKRELAKFRAAARKAGQRVKRARQISLADWEKLQLIHEGTELGVQPTELIELLNLSKATIAKWKNVVRDADNVEALIEGMKG